MCSTCEYQIIPIRTHDQPGYLSSPNNPCVSDMAPERRVLSANKEKQTKDMAFCYIMVHGSDLDLKN